MKIPLTYPKIPDTTNCLLKRCFAYEKLDGTNMHWCWNAKDHWYAFGTRRNRYPFTESGFREFHKEHPGLEDVINDFEDCQARRGLSKPLDVFLSGSLNSFSRVTKVPYRSAKEVIFFTEYVGEKSFAGQHQKDDRKDHYIIDLMVDGKFITPEELEYDFQDFRWCLPRIVYKGKFNGDFIENVRKNKYKVVEGVVCKGMVNGEVYRCKIKTNAYLEKLKERFKDDWQQYWE